jgi:hypothetical protein
MGCWNRFSTGLHKHKSRRRQGDGPACLAPPLRDERGRSETARGRQGAPAAERFGLAFPAPSAKALAGADGRPGRVERRPAAGCGAERQVRVVRENP